MPDDALISDPGLHRKFLEYNRAFRINNSRVGCILVMVLVPFGATLDFFVYPGQWIFFLKLRMLCSLLTMGIWWALSKTWGQRHYRLLGMSWFMLPTFFISLFIFYTEGVLSPYYAGLNLVLIGVTWVAQMDVVESVIAVVLTLVMYTLACWGKGSISSALLFNNYYFIVLTGIIVVTGSYYLNKLRYREYILRFALDQSKADLENSNTKLIELDRAKSNFFANISHELRTPLTLLIGPLDRLRVRENPPSQEERAEMLDIMYQNAMRLLRLINDLLTLVRMDSGKMEVRPERVELEPFIEGICRSVSAMAREKDIALSWEIRCDREGFVALDRDKVEKILLNLLFNAFKFTPESGRVRVTAVGEEGRVELAVHDTGTGMSEEDVSRVFERFWQAESSSNRRFQGVGLGLAMVRDLARLHGGEVRVKSRLGVGTSMQVTLDASMELASPEEHLDTGSEPAASQDWLGQLYRRAEFFPAHVRGAARQEQDPEARDGGPEKPLILVADDEPEMMRFLRSQLKSRFRLHEASDGLQAVGLAEKNRYQLILLDFMMPHLDGVEVVKRLRDMPEHRSVPVIILTARADEDSKIHALEAGATDFLSKPFASTELLVRCRNLAAAYELQQEFENKTRRLEEAMKLIKETEMQMVQQAKMASLGQLSAGLLHEINNPLNFATTALFLLKKRMLQPETPADALEKPMKDLQDGIRRVADIVSSLREFTHPDAKRFEAVDLNEVTTQAVRFVQIQKSEILLEMQVEVGCRIQGNANQLIHLCINLLQNAADSLREKGGAGKRIGIVGKREGGEVVLIVEDNGKGMSEEVRTRIFEAFFTTKKVGQGVGLGLSICHRIVEQHGGAIEVESLENEWCRFKLRFPALERTKTKT
jgi:signal transduction histidine kinase